MSNAGNTGQILPLELDPGRTALRRLNRAECNNTLRDLLGTAKLPGDSLPVDEEVEGMDTVGSALSFGVALHHGQRGDLARARKS